ncbi:hypothetical protein BDR05DRAFT_945368 [Suillus weaverae]|nr:hypothetical protein BDR05DRAFT_945368 [Suillus weaverae]
MSQMSTQGDSPPSEVGALKRQLALLEAQNAELCKLSVEEKSVRLHLEGCIIRRLICLTECVEDLITEFDRHVTLGIELDDDATVNDPEDDRMYRSYKKLATWCPSVHKLIHSVVEDSELSCIYSKTITGATEYERCDPLNPIDGLFKGKLLLKTFKYNFTSPTSAELDNQEQTSLAMLSTQAVQVIQLRFALSSIGSWCIIDDKFNHQEFYDNIVDFLKLTVTSDAVKEVEDLLLWWNWFLDANMHPSIAPKEPNRCLLLGVQADISSDFVLIILQIG